MHKTPKRGMLTCGMLMLSAAGVAAAGPPKGIQHYDWSFEWFPEGIYVPCLNDTLTGMVYVTTRSHSFETPSGTVHMVESFFGTGYVYSNTTGNSWSLRFAIPITGNVVLGKGETYNVAQNENYVPDVGDGRHWFYASNYKLTVNANGELVVERSVPPDDGEWQMGDYTRCVGNDKK